jgi:Flp pilus assembly protein TadG
MLPFLMLVFGIVDFGRLIWTQSALQYAVEKTARCAAVNTSTCGTPSQIQAYAGLHMFAPGVPDTAFTPSTVACGSNVSASTSFTFISTILMPAALTLTARSCYPT